MIQDSSDLHTLPPFDLVIQILAHQVLGISTFSWIYDGLTNHKAPLSPVNHIMRWISKEKFIFLYILYISHLRLFIQNDKDCLEWHGCVRFRNLPDRTSIFRSRSCDHSLTLCNIWSAVAELLCRLWGWDASHQKSRPGSSAVVWTPGSRSALWVRQTAPQPLKIQILFK